MHWTKGSTAHYWSATVGEYDVLRLYVEPHAVSGLGYYAQVCNASNFDLARKEGLTTVADAQAAAEQLARDVLTAALAELKSPG